jgi:hypothetical protein
MTRMTKSIGLLLGVAGFAVAGQAADLAAVPPSSTAMAGGTEAAAPQSATRPKSDTAPSDNGSSTAPTPPAGQGDEKKDGPIGGTSSPPLEDVNRYAGDTVYFPVNVKAKLPDQNDKDVCIPAEARLQGIKSYHAERMAFVRRIRKPDDKDPKTMEPARGVFTSLRVTMLGDALTTEEPGCELVNVPVGQLIETEVRQDASTFGLTYGTLVVPYKYHPTGKKELTGSLSLGPYLGYKINEALFGFSVTPALFVGAAQIPVEHTDNGQTTKGNEWAMSYGFAVLGNVKGGFQAGLVFGMDSLSKDAGYVYNNRPWFAVELGFAFSQ